MNDLPFHVLLFVLAGTVIVGVSCMFTESDDRNALRIFPRRLLFFFVGCTLVALVMLALEFTFAGGR